MKCLLEGAFAMLAVLVLWRLWIRDALLFLRIFGRVWQRQTRRERERRRRFDPRV